MASPIVSLSTRRQFVAGAGVLAGFGLIPHSELLLNGDLSGLDLSSPKAWMADSVRLAQARGNADFWLRVLAPAWEHRATGLTPTDTQTVHDAAAGWASFHPSSLNA